MKKLNNEKSKNLKNVKKKMHVWTVPFTVFMVTLINYINLSYGVLILAVSKP